MTNYNSNGSNGDSLETAFNPPVSQADGSSPIVNNIMDPYSNITEDKEIDLSTMTKITQEDILEEERQAIVKTKEEGLQDILGMMDNALDNENARLEETESQEFQEMVIESKKASGEYAYVETERQPPAVKMLDSSEFSSDYTDDETFDDLDENDSTDVDEDDDRTLHSAIALLNLPDIKYEPENPANVVTVRRERKTHTQITKTSRFKEGGDQAFSNTLAKMKKNMFRTVQVPLINSGFWVDVVGTGAADLIMLCSGVDQNTTWIEYEMEKMKTTLRGIVSTMPKVPMESIRNRIHSADYQMLAFGRVCATFNEISSVGSCPECGGEVRYKANPADMLLNYDEMASKINQMREVKSATELSLLKTDRTFLFESSGIKIVMGHPTYIDTVSQYDSVRYYRDPSNGLTESQFNRMMKQFLILTMVRSAVLPDGTRAANIYQKYLAIGMLNSDELQELEDCAREMNKQIITLTFGIKDVICPHCGKKVTIDAGNDIDDLVFMHSTVTRALALATEKGRTNG